MPRPRKWRAVGFIPQDLHFVPVHGTHCELKEEILKVEEIESIRLKDLLGLNQDECAQKMQVSRQTFQRILLDARTKIARALIEGKALRVEGGDFTRNVCRLSCANCERKWEECYEQLPVGRHYECPSCGSSEVVCCKENGFCKKGCCKRFS